MPLLQTKALAKRFGGLVANDGIDLAIEAGEVRGVIGPNGAGKTTLVNLIAGLYPPSSGEIELGGERITGLPPQQIARLGLVRTFQVARLFAHLTLRENLRLPALVRDRSRTARRRAAEHADRLLELTKLTALADAPARVLSGGQQALVQCAAGFMLPKLRCYVMDEPFAGINPVIKETIVELIERENRERGITFLIVSHEMEIVRRLCPKVTVLIEGRVFTEGALETVAADPRVITAYLGRNVA
ncbi:MAG: ABC transporter ATP-binding protein [Vulcanimicrobiaceae bacterium]